MTGERTPCCIEGWNLLDCRMATGSKCNQIPLSDTSNELVQQGFGRRCLPPLKKQETWWATNESLILTDKHMEHMAVGQNQWDPILG